MKKIFLLAALAIGATEARAQSIAAGTISLGGSIGYSTRTDKSEYKLGNNMYTDEFTQSQFRFSPSVGYFFADNLAIGLNLGYAATKSTVAFSGPGRNTPNSLDAATTLRVGPYVQYYKMLTEQFGVLGTLGAGYQRGFTPSFVNNSTGNVLDTKSSGFYAGLTPGIIFFPIPKFGISASVGSLGYERLGVTRSDDSDGESRTISNFGAGFGFDQLLLGGTFYIGR